MTREGQLTSERKDVYLETLAQSCLATLDTAEASDVVEETRLTHAEDKAFRRLLENLGHNVVEHDGEDVTRWIGMLRDGFYVEDDGAGIAEDEREDIFEASFTIEEVGTKFGMVRVRKIVLNHGCHMRPAENSEGAARFEFTDVEFTAE